MKKCKDLKIAFLGSGSFAEPIFYSLSKSFPNVFLILKKQEPKGRKSKDSSRGLKKIADNLNVPTHKVATNKDLELFFKENEIDVGIVASFGIIINKETLNKTKFGFINIHPSLLPHYRGPSPISSQILSEEKNIGITFIKMEEKIDSGPIIYQKKTNITKPYYEELENKLSHMAAEEIPNLICDFVNKKIKPVLQDKTEATYSKIIKKNDGEIDWHKETAEEIERKIRAFHVWPSAFTKWNGKLLKIIKGNSKNKAGDSNPSMVIDVEGKIGVGTKKGILMLQEVQLEGKKINTIEEFARGHDNFIGSRLG